MKIHWQYSDQMPGVEVLDRHETLTVGRTVEEPVDSVLFGLSPYRYGEVLFK